MRRFQGCVNREALPAAEASLQRIAIAAECVHITDGCSLSNGLAEHICVARVQAFECAALIPCCEGRDQMVLQPDVENMSPERWPPLLAENVDDIRIAER